MNPGETKRVIVLPNGRSVTLGEYARSWRELKTLPPESSIRGWDHFPATVSGVLAAIRFGVHDRINRHVPGYGDGRKWDIDWQAQARRCGYAVNTPRLIVRKSQVPIELRARLAHRIHQES